MSESCDSKCEFSSLVISDLILLCSSILSHPLYFLYLLFFSPYLLKLVSFLSPLFVTTFIVFLAFLVHNESSHTRFAPILERLRFEKDCPINEDDDDDLEIFEIVFGSSPSMAAALATDQNPSEFLDEKPEKDHILPETNLFLGSDPSAENKSPCVVMEEKRLENFLKILDEFERLASSNVEEKKKRLEPSRGAKSEKVVEKQNSLLRNGSEAETACNDDKNIDDSDNSINSKSSQSQRMSSDEGRSWRELEAGGGSMRREREWKRTLACKLFEERHNAEGMDSLWEAHEMESTSSSKVVKREKGKKKKVVEEDEEEVGAAQLCCLQALKLSAGKMNLGVGRPNLVKISKAIKGIGWLHKLSKNSKKVHNNGDHRF